jgi:chitosanase
VGRRLAACAALAAVLACPAAAPSSPAGAGEEASPARSRGLSPGQRRRADKLISQFENSTSKIQYCYIDALDDGRGYTAGRAGFTSATGDLLEVAERYTQIAGNNALVPLLPRLRELAANADGSIDGLETLPDAWATTCTDARQRKVQDAVVDEEYYLPARRHWRKLGLHTALSLAAIYDAAIQHGDGEDPDGVPAMLRRAARRAGGTPRADGVRERRFLKAFLAVRRATLAYANDPSTREAWAQTVTRVDAWKYLVRTGQWRLASPVEVHIPDYDFKLT